MSSNEGKYLVKSIPMEAIKLKSMFDSQALYEEVTLLTHTPGAGDTPRPTPPNPDVHFKRSKSSQGHDSSASSQSGRTAGELSNSALAFLRLSLSLPHPFRVASELLLRADVKSGSVRDALTKELQRHKLIVIHELQKSRSRLQIWEPTCKAYEIIGLAQPSFHSKGGFLHQFIAHHVVESGKRLGYVARREFFLSNQKAVDVALIKDDTLIAVEIAISPPLTKELENIVADFAAETQPTRLVFVTINSKVRKELEALISSDNRTNVFKERIQLTLAGSFINTGPESHDVYHEQNLW